MVAVKLQAYTPPPTEKIIEFTYDMSRRPGTLTRMTSNLLSALSSSFGLGETTEKAEAADLKEVTPPETVPGSATSGLFDPSSIVSASATPTTVLSFLPPSSQSSSQQTSSTVVVSYVIPPITPSLVRSDSEMARELDRQLNGGP